MRTEDIDLLGGFYSDSSKSWAAQDVVNWRPVAAEVAGTRTRMKLMPLPGMRKFTEVVDGTGSAPIRGLHVVEGRLFVVAGTQLYQVSNIGGLTPRGRVPGVGRVHMAHNQITGGNQLLVVNGQGGGGYVWDTVKRTFAKISDPAYPGSIAAAYMDSYLLQVEPFGRYWFHSDLADAMAYNSLDRAESEASPDRIVYLDVSQNEVVVFNETTTEFFYNAGQTTGTLQNKGILIERGCASGASVARLDNSLFWLGDDGVVYRLNGYQAVPVSTGPVQEAFRGKNMAQAFAFKWEDERSKVYYLTFPDGQTWGYDVVSGLWHRRKSFGFERWRLNDLVRWNGRWIGGDFQNGQLWELDQGFMMEGDQPLERERRSQVISAGRNRVTCNYLELLARTGDETDAATLTPPEITGVTLIPSTGNFAYSLVPHRRYVGGQLRSNENLHADPVRTDVIVALDQLFESFPSCHTVSLVVSWFGDDLRAGNCQIKPRLAVAPQDAATVSWQPTQWKVGDVTASTATLVTYVNNAQGGYSVYGSTPSDDSIIEVVRYLRQMGKRVVFYPFVLMDVPTGNTLPNPYGGSSQPVNPWRGRVTCFPAPGVAGTPDGTAAAGTQIDTFFTRQWGFNNFIRHYIDLCMQAGGVDVFLIGTEMVGITQVRSARTVYPGVAHLKTLAGEVKAALPACKVSYAADWTEYHSRQYPNGDLNFHLDPLWADPNVDFIGIDNYLPIADVRSDGDPTLIYDIGYLRSNIEGGELYDWYYIDRTAGTKGTITDGGYNKPWVYRQKDLRGWWSNAHVTRQAYTETTPTAWAPKSKPIWLTEYGCAAINRGPNQPNVFFDPQSSESMYPYFSTGQRDDRAQWAYYQAMIGYWQAFGGDMLSPENMIAWTWDARPYPQFPLLTAEWGDYGNFPRGHWLQGRYSDRGPDRLIEVCYSDDGGHNWSNWRQRSLGEMGQFNHAIKLTRLGTSRERIWRIRTSSPIPTELHGAVANMELLA